MVKVTGAHYGLLSWIQQRVTAVVMILIAIVFIALCAYLALHVNANISSWQNAFSALWIKILVQLFIVAMLLHAWVGMRDIWMDYINCSMIKLSLHVTTILWLCICLIYSIKVIWA